MGTRDTKTRERAERELLLKVLGTPAGRRFVYNVLSKGGIYGHVSSDPVAAQRELGRRDVALEVLQDVLTVYPDVYILMQQEAARFDTDYPVTQGEEDDG